MEKNTDKLRMDIQGLRGIAVLMVVLYHLEIGGLAGGYLGVDIFFVISGYLITRLVASGMSRGDFSFREFYLRRAKRLLPAAFVTFAVTTALAPWFLNQQELRDYAVQLLGALTFTGNIVLWQQTGYFEGAGDLKPLLHVWSLAIEEQYYFFLPAVLFFTRPARWFMVIGILLCASLMLCVAGMAIKPIATFYLLPTRAWELLIGSVGALWVLQDHVTWRASVDKVMHLLAIPALLCLLVLPFFPLGGGHPGGNALLVCIATLIVILGKHIRINNTLLTRGFAKIGDFSYSLYLVHWPIIALVKNSWTGTGEMPFHLRALMLLASFILAYALYKTVEDPLRRWKITFSKSLFAKVALSSAVLASLTPAVISAQSTAVDFKEVRKANYGLAVSCDYDAAFSPRPECRTSNQPNLVVWGDSFAMHLVPGLARTWKGGVLQATKSSCEPFLGVSLKNIAKPDRGIYKHQAWAEDCIEFNRTFVEFLRTQPAIEYVVVASTYAHARVLDNIEHVVQHGSNFVSSPPNAQHALESWHRTVEQIRAMGKRVVMIAPPPSSDFNVGSCLERQLTGAISLGSPPGCLIERSQYREKNAEVLSFLEKASRAEDVGVISFDSALCDASACNTMIDGTMIYRDAGHLAIAGSKLIVERMQLARAIESTAR